MYPVSRFPTFPAPLDAYDDGGDLFLRTYASRTGTKVASAPVLRPREGMRRHDWAVVLVDKSSGYPKLACGTVPEALVSVPYLLVSLDRLSAPAAKVAAGSILDRLYWSHGMERLQPVEASILRKVASISLTQAEAACVMEDGLHVKTALLGSLLSGAKAVGRSAAGAVDAFGNAIGGALNRGAGAIRSGLEAIRPPAVGAARAGAGAGSSATATIQTPQTLRMPAAQMDSTMMAPRARMGVPPPRAAAPAAPAAPPASYGPAGPPPPNPPIAPAASPQMPTRPASLPALTQNPRWTAEGVRARNPELFHGAASRQVPAPPPVPAHILEQQAAGHLSAGEMAHLDGLLAQGGRGPGPWRQTAAPVSTPGWSGGQGGAAGTGTFGATGSYGNTGTFGSGGTGALPPPLPAPVQSAYAPPPLPAGRGYAEAPTVVIPRGTAPAGTFAW